MSRPHCCLPSILVMLLSCYFMPSLSAADMAPHILLPVTDLHLPALIRGQKQALSFEITNDGTDDLVIHSIHAPCGCLKTKVTPTHVLEPGRTGAITVDFDSSLFAGHITRVITLDTNSPLQPTVSLSIHGFIKEDIALKPPLISLGEVDRFFATTYPVQVHSHDPHLVVTTIESSSPDIKGFWAKPGVLNVQISGNLPPGALREQLILTTTSPHMPQLVLPIVGEVERQVMMFPKYLEFGIVKEGKSVIKDVTFENKNPDFKIKHVTAKFKPTAAVKQGALANPENLFHYKITTEGAHKKSVSVTFSYPQENLEEALINTSGTLEITTNDLESPEISIPFYALLRKGL